MRFIFKTAMLGLPEDNDELLSYSSFHTSITTGFGIRFSVLECRTEEATVRYQIWIPYREQPRDFYQYVIFSGASSLILALDFSNPLSLNHLERWFEYFNEFLPRDFPILVVDITEGELGISEGIPNLRAQSSEEFQSQVPIAAEYSNIHFCRLSNSTLFEYHLQTFTRLVLERREVLRVTRPNRPLNLWPRQKITRYSTKTLIDLLETLLPKFKTGIRSNEFVYENQHGTFYVDLESGSVSLSPAKCVTCKKTCSNLSRRKYVCIQQSGRSWSNMGNFHNAGLLLTVAKIYAIVTNTFEYSVLDRVRSASNCPDYSPKRPTSSSSTRRSTAASSGQIPYNSALTNYVTQFLEELEERYQAGKISREVYEFHRARFRR
ncbi:MAG: hypothetical protein ACFFBD_15550 [Candidatus Hodarchaeota archaeon]